MRLSPRPFRDVPYACPEISIFTIFFTILNLLSMRRLSGIVLFALVLLITFGGCSPLPDRVAVDRDELSPLMDAFLDMVAEQKDCQCCIDARATVVFSSVWQKGTLSGYLQAMSPSFLKFVGINPLGQPLAVFVTDGESFRFAAVPQARGYEGEVEGETYAKYAPEGFLPEQGFYWLIGRLVPGPMRVVDLRRDRDGNGVWFELDYANHTRSLVLFEPERGVLGRHIVINDGGKKIFDVRYDDYTAGSCPLPGRITVSSLVHNSSMEILLDDWLPGVSFAEDDFTYEFPPSFERVVVK